MHWQIVHDLAAVHTQGITIDFFAAASSAIMQRFAAAWTAETHSQRGVWNHGRCVYGRRHREMDFFSLVVYC
jgi:allantoicase